MAFYDALETNDSAVKVLGEPTLKNTAPELVSHARKSVTIDWTLRESAQAQIRVLVRRILRKLRLSAGQAGKSHANAAATGEVALCGMGRGHAAAKLKALRIHRRAVN